MPVIDSLSPQFVDDDYNSRAAPFLQGLKETGYVEGQNVAVEYRWAANQYDRLPALAPISSVLVAANTPAALAAKGSNQTIPIVFATGADPVASVW
jgi:putative ABC transport system substrate-binding protein